MKPANRKASSIACAKGARARRTGPVSCPRDVSVVLSGIVNGFRFCVPVTPRFRDLDSLGHINNAVYFTYFEIGRNAYWHHLFGIRRLAQANFILAKAEINYRRQAREDQRLIVGVRTSRIGRTSFDFDYRIVTEDSDDVIAEGRTVQVVFDYAANRKLDMSPEVRDAILSFEGPGNVEEGHRS